MFDSSRVALCTSVRFGDVDSARVTNSD